MPQTCSPNEGWLYTIAGSVKDTYDGSNYRLFRTYGSALSPQCLEFSSFPCFSEWHRVRLIGLWAVQLTQRETMREDCDVQIHLETIHSHLLSPLPIRVVRPCNSRERYTYALYSLWTRPAEGCRREA